MNLPRIINRTGSPHPGSTQFRYDANGQRYEEVTGTGETTRFGPKGYEKVYHPAGRYARHRHELGPVIVIRQNGVDDITYVGRDRLGSTASVLPFNPYKGDLRSYDPFGNPRQGNFDDNGKTTEAGRLELRPITARGFTGHEHIDEGRVIHMNGRVYDYALGRFLGPDPIIQFPTSTQSLNPYSYIMNNPFAGTDPSGYTMSLIDRVFAKQRAASDAQAGCNGDAQCQAKSDSAFLAGPRANLGLTAGGAPADRTPGNGAEFARLVKRGLALADKIGTDEPKNSSSWSGSAWTAEDSMAAKKASAVYNDKTGGQLHEVGIDYTPSDGFQASFSKAGDGPAILAFAGTSPTSLANWQANIAQEIGMRASQYDQAVSLASRVWNATKGNVIFVGHSLGGGQAAAAAFATGGRAITFNAAGLSAAYRNGTPGNIRAHYIRGEIITTIQQWTPLPNAAGIQIPHSAPWYYDPVRRHLMERFQ